MFVAFSRIIGLIDIQMHIRPRLAEGIDASGSDAAAPQVELLQTDHSGKRWQIGVRNMRIVGKEQKFHVREFLEYLQTLRGQLI